MTTFLKAESSSSDHALPATAKSSSSSRNEVFGAQLKRARQKLNLSIEEIAERIKLDPRQVIALEEERFEELPGAAFVRGFTRQYARVLKIDEAPLLNLLPSATPALNSTANHLGVMPRTSGLNARKRSRTIVILLGIIVGTGLLGGGIYLLKHSTALALSNSSKTSSPSGIIESPVVSTQSTLPLSSGNIIVPTTPTTTTTTTVTSSENVVSSAASTDSSMPLRTSGATLESSAPTSTGNTASGNTVVSPQNGHISVKAPASVPPKIELSFEERSWVEIKDSQGRMLLSQMNLPGSRQSVKGEPPYTVTVGNPHAVSIQYKGSTLDIMPYNNHDTAHFTLD